MTTSWEMKGRWIKNCNCAAGCPCDFWQSPTHHECEGMLGMDIEDGRYGDTDLSGLKFIALYHWPGPLHEGNGQVQPIIDERATPAQRDALLTILGGQAGNPWFEVVASIVTTVHDPIFAPIEFECDVENRTASVRVPGVMETVTEPVKDLASGDSHRVRIDLPSGMEYRSAEIGTASVNRSSAKIAYDCPNGHSSLAYVHHTHEGLLA